MWVFLCSWQMGWPLHTILCTNSVSSLTSSRWTMEVEKNRKHKKGNLEDFPSSVACPRCYDFSVFFLFLPCFDRSVLTKKIIWHYIVVDYSESQSTLMTSNIIFPKSNIGGEPSLIKVLLRNRTNRKYTNCI